VALKFVIDDFSIHAVEECLLNKIPGIFTPEIVISLEDAIIEDIAAETEESKVERSNTVNKKQILERALVVLHRLDRHKPKGTQRFALLPLQRIDANSYLAKVEQQKIREEEDIDNTMEDSEMEDSEMEDSEMEDSEMEDSEMEDSEMEDSEIEDSD
jgi:hypothetical protein